MSEVPLYYRGAVPGPKSPRSVRGPFLSRRRGCSTSSPLQDPPPPAGHSSRGGWSPSLHGCPCHPGYPGLGFEVRLGFGGLDFGLGWGYAPYSGALPCTGDRVQAMCGLFMQFVATRGVVEAFGDGKCQGQVAPRNSKPEIRNLKLRIPKQQPKSPKLKSRNQKPVAGAHTFVKMQRDMPNIASTCFRI